MKKTYIQPSIEAVKIMQSVMLGGSAGQENVNTETQITMDNDIASFRGGKGFVEITDEE